MQKLVKISFFVLLLSLPFGYRRLFHQFTFGFDEYEAIFLYASDILLILFLGLFTVFVFRFKAQILNFKNFSTSHFLLFTFLFFAAVSIFLAQYQFLALYNFARLLLLVFAALAIAALIRDEVVKLSHVFGVIAGLAVIQSFIGFLQFARQGSLGLWFLGESVLSPFIGGAAKISVAGGVLLRAYGTFPHPNILAAFLLLGLLALYYFWLNRSYERSPDLERNAIGLGLNPWSDIIIGVGIFIVAYGLILSFSRIGWIVAAIGMILTLVWTLCQKEYRVQSTRLFIILFSIFCFLFSTIGWAIFPRANIAADEPAVTYRLSYNELGLHLIKENQLGVGVGNQVIYSVKNGAYKTLGMSEAWQWQPIHNIYLLIGSEIGILGLFVFLVFLALSIFKLENFIPKIMLLSLLIFGLADHFFWTLQPGRLMLWAVVGIVLGLTSDRRESS